MMDTDLADRLRYWLTPAGFEVVEVDGWQSRGRTYAAYAPQGSLQHHTAGALAGGDAPSLGIVINGRSDLPGPLSNVFGSRSLVAYVVAAGTCNHAGRGGWNGLTGNWTVGGMEMEHDGGPDEPRTERLMDFCARVQCALITAPGSPADPANTCQHFEWSIEGKIDFYQWPGDDLRQRVTALLASGPGSTPHPDPGDDMIPEPGIELDNDGRVWSFVRGTDERLWAQVLQPDVVNSAGVPEIIVWTGPNGPFSWFPVEGPSGEFLISSGPTVKRVGVRLLVSARGKDGHQWGILVGPNPASVPAPIGNITGWFDLGGLS